MYTFILILLDFVMMASIAFAVFLLLRLVARVAVIYEDGKASNALYLWRCANPDSCFGDFAHARALVEQKIKTYKLCCLLFLAPIDQSVVQLLLSLLDEHEDPPPGKHMPFQSGHHRVAIFVYNYQMEHVSFPKLSLWYLVREPRTPSENPPLHLLLHGYGSNESDLFDLADELPPEYLALSVRAPLVLSEGSYAWFSLDYSKGAPVGDKEEAEAARIQLQKFITEVVGAFTVDEKQIYLVGFSQGAIMSASVALTYPTLVKGIALLSGRVLKEIRPMVNKEAVGKLQVFIGHGTEDTVLPISFALEAKEYLYTLGITPEYHEYRMGHNIIREEVVSLIRFLTSTR